MSDEGFALVMRVLLVVVLIISAASFRTLFGPGKARGLAMLAGTLGGLSFGVLVASPISTWLGIDVSAICACLGMVLGWGVAWFFARQIPRHSN